MSYEAKAQRREIPRRIRMFAVRLPSSLGRRFLLIAEPKRQQKYGGVCFPELFLFAPVFRYL
jgi:hypothetical protein